MVGRDVEKVMAGKDTITISQMFSFKGRRNRVALFLPRKTWMAEKFSHNHVEDVSMYFFPFYEKTSDQFDIILPLRYPFFIAANSQVPNVCYIAIYANHGGKKMRVTRRQFFKISAGGLGASSVAALGFSPGDALAEVREFKLARTTETRNTCPYCSVGCGI